MVQKLASTLVVAALLGPLAAGVSARGLQPAPQPAPQAPAPTGNAALADKFLAYTTKFPDGISGAALIARDGKVLLKKSYRRNAATDDGTTLDNAIWDVASISKHYTAVGVLRLAMMGKLALDDPLSKYVPCPEDKAGVTIRHLLGHTSGINASWEGYKGIDPFDRDAAVASMLKGAPTGKPGESFAYSNVGFFILGAVIEKASGQPYERFMHEQVFTPAGLQETYIYGEKELPLEKCARDQGGDGEALIYGPKLAWGYRGAGGIMTTLADMARWDRALENDTFLAPELRKQMYTSGRGSYGLGVFLRTDSHGNKIVHHGGVVGTFLQYMVRRPSDGTIIVIFQDRNRGHLLAEPMAMSLLDILDSGMDLSAAPVPPESDAEKAAVKGRAPALLKPAVFRSPDGTLVKLQPEGNDIVVGTSDVATAKGVAEGMMTQPPEHIRSIGERALKIVSGALIGDAKELRSAYSDPKGAVFPAGAGSEAMVDVWMDFLAADPRLGRALEATHIATVLITNSGSHSYVRLRHEKGERVVLLVWEGNRLRAISPASETLATVHMSPALEEGGFVTGGDKRSWTNGWMRLEKSGSGAPGRLMFAQPGGAVLMAEPVK